MCPSCKAAFDRRVEMRGPVKHPTGSFSGLFFVCDRCNHTLKERRKQPRESPR